MKNYNAYIGITAILCSAISASSYGENSSATASPLIEEIFITARKRQESVLKVPVVETVLSAATLERYQVSDLQGVITKVPGLSSGNAILSIGEQVSIRGVGSSSLDQGVDQSVSLNVDSLSLTHGLAYRAATFDLEQVEILKGPQALYFGKNSTAGVISLRSKDPGDEFELIANTSYEIEADQARVELIISGPITDTLGIRLAGFYSDTKGFYKNVGTSAPHLGSKDPKYKRFGGGESYLIRPTVLWKPSDRLSSRLKLNFTKDTYNQGGSAQLVSCPDGLNAPAGVQFYSPKEKCSYDKEISAVDMDPKYFIGIRNNGTPFLELEQNFGTWELAYDLNNDLSITSVTGFYQSDADAMTNGTFSGYAGPPFAADNIFERNELTQEVRLDSDFSDSSINFTLGAYFQDGEMSNDFTLLGNTAFGFPATLTKGKSTIDINSRSIFGQVRWQATDKIELSSGVRWQREKRNLDVYNRLTKMSVSLAPGSDTIAAENFSPEISAVYTVTDDFTLFAALKKGFKSGSFNIVIPGASGEDKSFGDEKVEGGEIGIKSRWLNRSLSLNIAAYHYKYTGLQTGVNEPNINGLPVLRTLNAGESEVYGIEVDTAYYPTRISGLSLNFSANWNNAKFTKLENVPCWGGQREIDGCDQLFVPYEELPESQQQIYPHGRFNAQRLDGSKLTRAPEWEINFGGNYEVSLSKSMILDLGISNQYSSSYWGIVGTRNDYKRPSFFKTDLSATLYGPSDRWHIGIVASNIQNKLAAGFCSSTSYMTAQALMAPMSGAPQSSPLQRNAAEVDEVNCSNSGGRAIWVKFGYRI